MDQNEKTDVDDKEPEQLEDLTPEKDAVGGVRRPNNPSLHAQKKEISDE